MQGSVGLKPCQLVSTFIFMERRTGHLAFFIENQDHIIVGVYFTITLMRKSWVVYVNESYNTSRLRVTHTC